MRFSDIYGHSDVKDRLRAMADSGHLPHALLLEGTQGIGKFSLLRAFAQYIHCRHHTPDGDSCGVCPACIQHSSFNHIDTYFSFPCIKKGDKNPVSDDYIEQWKNFISKDPYMNMDNWIYELGNPTTKPQFYVSESEDIMGKLSFTAHGDSRYKIVLVWLPERMNEATANKLLKLIEEPFEDTIFLLSTNSPTEILPTIYSRCQRIKVKRYGDGELADMISSRFGIPMDDAVATAHISEGSVTRAEQALGQSEERNEDFSRFISLMRLAYQRKIFALRDWANSIATLSRDRQLSFLAYCIRMLRENFIYNLGNPELSYLNSEENAFSKNFARFITPVNVLKLQRLFSDAIKDISGNGNSKIIFFDVAVRVILLLKHD